MIHIVFQEADIEVLQKSFALDASLQGQVVHIQDDFAVGPLSHIYTHEGIEARRNWWRMVLAGGHYDGLADDGHVDDNKTAAALVETMRTHTQEAIWIWTAQNKHDVSGYYWLLHYLQEFQGRVFILFLNNLPFLSEKGQVFYPVNLFNIPPKEFLKAKKLARAITPGEFDMDTEEWTRLCAETKGVRILEGGKKLAQFDDDFYDESLLQFIGAGWQKAGRLMHQFLSKAPHTTGDAYLLWRLKKLIEAGLVDVQGEMRNMKDFDVKLNMAEPVAL